MKIANLEKKYFGKIDYLDLELLIAHGLKKTREFVLAHPEQAITNKQETIIKRFITRRIKHEPLAYILGRKEFYELSFKVTPDTLVPRPETEQIIKKILGMNPRNRTIIDVGTGSGNIIISLAKNLQAKNKFIAIEVSSKALKVAKQNAKLHKVGKKIKFLRGNLLKPFLKSKNYKPRTKNCIVVTNLPYLDLDWKNLLKSSDTKGLKYEPDVALYAGKDGLDAYRKLSQQIKPLKNKNIIVFCEIGHLQKPGMKKIFSFAKEMKFHKDLSGKWRVCEIAV